MANYLSNDYLGKIFTSISNGINNRLAAYQKKLSVASELSLTNNKLSLTAAAKKQLFIDLWCAAVSEYGGYNPEQEMIEAPDPGIVAQDAILPGLAITPGFHLNDLSLTYEEAIDVYTSMTMWPPYALDNASSSVGSDSTSKPRTTIPVIGNDGVAFPRISWAWGLEVVRFTRTNAAGTVVPVMTITHEVASRLMAPDLVAVKDLIKPVGTYVRVGQPGTLDKLTELYLHEVSQELELSALPALSIDSMEYLVDHAANTTEITIHLNLSVYMKLTNASLSLPTPIADAERWTAVLEAATAKNIRFTTN